MKRKISKIAFLSILSIIMLMTFTAPTMLPGDNNKASAENNVYVWSQIKAPNYYVRVGKAKVSEKPSAGTVRYSNLDRYGRARTVTANITYKMIQASRGWREQIAKSQDPAGWGHNRRVCIKLSNGKVYKGYFYNRSHLLADCLGGRAIRKNLITGTRMQNVGNGSGGMAYTEKKVMNYIYSHKSVTAYYKVTPVYRGAEKLPRAVIVDVKTSNDAINMRVIVYNCAKGYKINYRTGVSKGKGITISSKSKKAKKAKRARKIKRRRRTNRQSRYVYITRTGKRYHSSRYCSGLNRARSITRVPVGNARGRGLSKCKLCW